MTSATKTGGELGFLKLAGKAGRADSADRGTEVVALLEGTAKHVVTRRNGRRDKACIRSYTDGGVGVEMSCR